MKIEFTREEYRRLLDIVFMADWVINAHKIKENSKTEKYNKLEQKIYSYAKEMGFEDLIEYAPDHEKYYSTRKFEDEGRAMAFIYEFENDTFWDELISRLADRDLIRQIGGIENLSQLSFEERIERTVPLEEKYSSEFEERGLDGVSIV